MADFSTTCQTCVESAREFLQLVGACTPEVNQRLTNLKEVSKILSGLIQEPVARVDQQWPNLARNLSKLLMFGGGLELIVRLACHSSIFNQVEAQQKADENSKLPLHLQKKVEEIAEYLEKGQKILNTIDKIMQSLMEKVREAKDTNFKGIRDVDCNALKMDVEDLECELKASKKYLDSAQAALDQFKSDIEAEKRSHKIKVSAFTTGCLAVLTIGGVALSPTISQMGAVQKFSQYILGELGTAGLTALGIGLTATAASVALAIYYYIICYCKMLDEQVGKLETDLRKAITEYEVQEMRFKKRVKERMNR